MNIILSIDPVKFPLTGIGRYTYELARGLQQCPSVNLKLLQGYRLRATLPLPDTHISSGLISQLKQIAQKSRITQDVYRAISPQLKKLTIRHLHDHIFHGPNYYLPPFSGQSIVTVHDLSIYTWPECHPPERVRYMQKEIVRSLKRATALITDTEHTRQEVAAYFNWPLERIHAIHLAASEEFQPRAATDLQPTLSSLGLTAGEYALYTGTIEPRKNLTVLLQAYATLPIPLKQRHPLVIAGYRGWKSSAIHDLIDQGQCHGWLRYLGYVPHEILPMLMAGARIFTYPSLYEGFGLPVLEAMACGIPVICSSASTLPEVAGSAAMFHAPEDIDTLAAMLRLGLEDEQWRNRARTASLDQAARFSWFRCTQQTLNVYRNLVKD